MADVSSGAPESARIRSDIDSSIGELAKVLADLTQEQWDAIDVRLGTATSIPVSDLAAMTLMDRLADNFPRPILTGGTARTLVFALTSPYVRDQLAKAAPEEVVNRVATLQNRHGSVVEAIWNAFGEAEDWIRMDVEYSRVFFGQSKKSRARVATYRRDGQRQSFETTDIGLLRYLRTLMTEVTSMPTEIAESIDSEAWQPTLERAQALIEFVTKASAAGADDGSSEQKAQDKPGAA